MQPSASLVTKACQLWPVQTHDAFLYITNVEFHKLVPLYLCVELEVTLSSHASIDDEFCWFVDNDTSWLQTWSIGFHLQPQKTLFLKKHLISSNFFKSDHQGNLFVLSRVVYKPVGITFSGKTSLTAGRMWAMNGLSLMSLSSQMTWTA